MTTPTTIRRAALVLARLDVPARESVLARMPEEKVDGIRGEMAALQASDFDNQDSAIQDFLTNNDRQSSERLDVRFPEATVTHQPAVRTMVASSSIHDLLKFNDEAIAKTIVHERSTTVAALLTALPGERAGGILKRLPPKLRARVVSIWEPGISAHPRAVDTVAEWICDHLAESNIEPAIGQQQHDALKAILNEFDPDERRAMLGDLAEENPLLAKRLAEETSCEVNETHRESYS